jgi:hypothetical protein
MEEVLAYCKAILCLEGLQITTKKTGTVRITSHCGAKVYTSSAILTA